MDQRISLITLGVGDLARARRFYEQGLGWTPLSALDEVAFYQLPGLGFALFERKALELDAGRPIDGAFSGFAVAINERSRDAVDATIAQAVAAGGKVTKPAETAPWGGYSGYVADLDGHAWEVAWNPGCTIHPDGSTTFGGA
ncbi:MAG: VOC family protein [Alphaproteobacteria bacterium]|nr:VOC family protein [Alphaproteobacteria bacterium]MBU1513806.1 VOC family protein [Alphaproteobacteria bacterium]MBU2094549.1 VOC family protein [Alphaproteobacteria bacterium]MBU2151251.1 VOC family protein [Alphaproteobacteria bacterium]MBU2305544.1 VOC family protein [Alphaproteobacteria bacterium]